MKKIGLILFLLIGILHINTYAQSEEPLKLLAPKEVKLESQQPDANTLAKPWEAPEEDKTVNGITIGPNCLLNGQCKFNVYDTLGIKKSIREEGDPTSVGLFVQDIILAATTFIGSILTLAIIVSGLMYIFAAASGKDPAKAKSGLVNAFIGLLIVILSYSIIRLVQYLAKGV